MKLIRVGVDLAKNVFQVHGVDRKEKALWRRRLTRENWVKVLLETVEPGCEIGMESCGGAHHWARRLQEKGFTVRLIAPQFVKPYVKSNKNDANDAEAKGRRPPEFSRKVAPKSFSTEPVVSSYSHHSVNGHHDCYWQLIAHGNRLRRVGTPIVVGLPSAHWCYGRK